MNDDIEELIISALALTDCLYTKAEYKDYVNLRNAINLLANRIEELNCANDMLEDELAANEIYIEEM